jgi:AAA domain/Bifunctional DNA primase/polymerase, N-terminal
VIVPENGESATQIHDIRSEQQLPIGTLRAPWGEPNGLVVNGIDLRDPFVAQLNTVGVTVWVAEPGGDDEFIRARGWTKFMSHDNSERLKAFRPGMAICANTGGIVVVIDVDPRNGGDVENVRALLKALGVRIFAEVVTPGGGRHFYVRGHPQLPSVHSTETNKRLPGFPGVDIQSFGSCVFLPVTLRPKYRNAGYRVVFNELAALARPATGTAEPLVHWVAEQLANKARKTASAKDRRDYFEQPAAQPWTGGKPAGRQQAYLDAVLAQNTGMVADSKPGERNSTLFLAAMKCGSFAAGAGMNTQGVGQRLLEASMDCGLIDEDGEYSVQATINSGFSVGFANPRAVPDGPGQFREIELISLDSIKDAAPKWAWTHDGFGRMQVAALTLFAGRPATGKSMAARWFAARLSRGELEGCWEGNPQNVAYIAAEETAKYVLKPSLRAAGANMGRIFMPRVRTAEGEYVPLLADDDERDITDQLVARKVSVIVSTR